MASVGFRNKPLAQIIFVTFMFSSMLMMGLYSKFGFERILGTGYVLWFPLLICIMTEIPATLEPFKSYLIILSLSIAISLVFDIIDVWKFFANRKTSLQQHKRVSDN